MGHQASKPTGERNSCCLAIKRQAGKIEPKMIMQDTLRNPPNFAKKDRKNKDGGDMGANNE